jgi:alpha-tubulin suppressor-like RCC1 family protein
VQVTESNIVQIAVGYEHTCLLTIGGEVKCAGYNVYGQLGNGTTNNSSTFVTAVPYGARSISAGNYHTCALLGTGEVKCWGYNTYGQLGDGTTTNRSSPVTVDSSP